MRTRFSLALAGTLALAAACTEHQSSPTAPVGSPSLSVSPGSNGRFGMVLRPGAHPRGGDGIPTPSPTGDMTNHGGGVMTTNVTYALFSGPDWQVNSMFTGDKITSMESFLTGRGGSVYGGILSEYSAGGGSSYLGRLVNNGAALSANASASDLVSYVCDQLNANGITARNDAIYIVFTED